MKWQVFGVGISMILSAIGLGLITSKTDPATASFYLKTLFFIALFILIWSIATLIIFSIKGKPLRSRLLNKEVYDSIFNASSFWGFLISSAVITLIFIKKYFRI